MAGIGNPHIGGRRDDGTEIRVRGGMSASAQDAQSTGTTYKVPYWNRRLPDALLIIFHSACDQGDLEVARRLLPVLDVAVHHVPTASGPRRRRDREALVAAWERLWTLQHMTG